MDWTEWAGAMRPAPGAWRVVWPQLATPDPVSGRPPIVWLAGDGPDGRTPDLTLLERARRRSRLGRRVLVLTPDLLRTPPFRADAPWISLRVAGEWRDGAACPAAPPAAPPSATDSAGVAPAEQLAERLVREELGGWFWAPSPAAATLRPGRVLVRATADGGGKRRLRAALAGWDAARVLLLLDRPDPALAEHARRAGCAVWTGPANPWPLLDGAAAVLTHRDDPLGALAVLAGVAASDAGTTPRQRGEAVAALSRARHVDPFTGRPIGGEAALDIVAEWRRVIRANRAIGACTGMAFWKRRRMAAFLHDGARAPPHRRTAAAAVRAAGGRAVAAWSSRLPPGLLDRAAAAGTPVARVEDGFIRSLGLGSGFLPPGSVVVDARGIYYDPARPSDLEVLLRDTRFEPRLLERAARLAARLVREGVTKYGAGTAGIAPPLPPPDGRRRILVPGQVADDLSVRLAGAGVAGNADLLARVRAANPDAFIVYKPHPDVLAGHRPGAVPDAVARRHADHVVTGGAMAALIAAVDEVHTLTSLAGFEALLRGRRVVVHGQPFYAGWGLTEDLAPPPRRDRALTLDELCAGALLLYPRYIDPLTELPCPAEVLLDRLAAGPIWRETPLMRLRRWQGRVLALAYRARPSRTES